MREHPVVRLQDCRRLFGVTEWRVLELTNEDEPKPNPWAR